MIRRDFLKVMGGILTQLGYLEATQAAGQSSNNAKVMIFGVAVISGNQAGHKAVFPTIGKHASFLVGQRKTLDALASSQHKPVSVTGSNIAEGHDDIGLSGEFLLCYPGPHLSIGTGESQMSPSLSNHLPRLAEIGDLMDSSKRHSIRTPPGSLEVTLRGGHLRIGKYSRNRGTHGIPWQFVDGDRKEIGGPCQLTDLLVYHSQSAEMEIAVNGVRKALLAPGERLWIVNFPTYAQKDTTPLVIEHAHEWLSLVTPEIPGARNAEIHARTPFKRDESKGLELQHPCGGEKAEVRLRPEPGLSQYFPPDTDPCFIVAE